MPGEINPVGQSEKPAADWNVLMTLAEPTFRIARKLLARWGVLRRTEYFNVAVMAVADPACFLREFGAAVEQSPGILNAMSHVVLFEHLFRFEDAAEFETKAREFALTYVPRLIGKSFHVRLHRRGLKGTISTPTEERILDEALLGALAAAGGPGRISFEDPDCVLLIETVGQKGRLGALDPRGAEALSLPPRLRRTVAKKPGPEHMDD